MKTERPTAVSRNGEKCGKFMYFFRKKYYLSGKLSGYEVRHFLKPRHVGRQFGGAKKHTSKQFNYKKNYSNF
jgi:hypothetical protein